MLAVNRAPARTLALLLLACVTTAAGAQATRPPHLLVAEVNMLRRSTPPWVSDRWVVFSYRPVTTARFVGIRFEHEGYAVLHPLTLNDELVFVLIYEPPRGLGELVYRMSVDGGWTRDPANPRYITDLYGTTYSVVDISSIPADPVEGVHHREDGRTEFVVRTEPGSIVSLAATFNRWDPFVHVMEETESGLYRLSLRLPSGAHYYHYLANGRKTLDPANPEVRRAPDGELENLLTVP